MDIECSKESPVFPVLRSHERLFHSYAVYCVCSVKMFVLVVELVTLQCFVVVGVVVAVVVVVVAVVVVVVVVVAYFLKKKIF